MANRITIAAIAEAAEVSSKTVSLALRNSQAVSPQTARRVREAAKRLGYQRHREPTALLGVITPRTSHPFYGDLLHTIEEYADHIGYSIMFRRTDFKVADELTAIHELDQARVDGIVLLTPSSPSSRLKPLVQPNRPMVAINSTLSPQPGLACLSADNETGARQAVDYLLDRGHTRIAYLAGPAGSLGRRRRIYEEALRQRGCFDYRYIVESGEGGPATYTHGYEACRQLIYLAPGEALPTAVFAFNDLVALGALRALHERGLRVPDDIWVIGFDDLDFARFTIPSLTTVSVPKRELASEAIKTLIRLIEAGPDGQTLEPVILATRFVLRESTPLEEPVLN